MAKRNQSIVLRTRTTNETHAEHSKLKGTTNIVVLLPDGVLLGYDSRGSNNDGHIVSDEVEKIKELTSKPSQKIKRQKTSPSHSPIVATMEGNVRQCQETWKFLEDNISLQGLRCSKPVTYTAILGLTYIRTLTKAEQQSSCYIAGMQEKSPTVYTLDYSYDKTRHEPRPKLKKLSTTYDATGSGKLAALRVLNYDMCERNKKLDVSVATNTVKKALLEAALQNPNTGGNLKVIYVTSHEVEHKSNNTVIELYLQFFDQLRVLSKMSVFIIYKLEEVNETQLLGWLMRGGDVLFRGHPLINLKGDYYLRRVTYITDSSVDEILDTTSNVPETTALLFTKSQHGLKFFDVEGNLASRVYIARVEEGFLRDLIISTRQGTWAHSYAPEPRYFRIGEDKTCAQVI